MAWAISPGAAPVRAALPSRWPFDRARPASNPLFMAFALLGEARRGFGEARGVSHLVVVPGSDGQQVPLDGGERQVDERRVRIAEDAGRRPFVLEDRHHALEGRGP